MGVTTAQILLHGDPFVLDGVHPRLDHRRIRLARVARPNVHRAIRAVAFRVEVVSGINLLLVGSSGVLDPVHVRQQTVPCPAVVAKYLFPAVELCLVWSCPGTPVDQG